MLLAGVPLAVYFKFKQQLGQKMLRQLLQLSTLKLVESLSAGVRHTITELLSANI